jgi:hypothetical protein
MSFMIDLLIDCWLLNVLYASVKAEDHLLWYWGTLMEIWKNLIILNLNCKNVHMHVKIYLLCNFEVNPITHFGVIFLFSSNFQTFNTFCPLFQKLYLNLTFISYSFWNIRRKVLKFKKFDEKRATTPK